MKRLLFAALAFNATSAFAFCGFYVAKGDAKLFNRASQVAIVRDEDRTVMTMANDFQGDPKEFAVVIPVPTKIERAQIHVADKKLIDHLDAYSSPRLVEYFDPDPCAPQVMYDMAPSAAGIAMQKSESATLRANSLGVTIEAQYTVGEYDILILSAKQSDGLAIWLTESGYTLPAGAGPVLDSYIKQHMHFFVAKVNLAEKSKLGYTYLRPLQVAYESPKFMLPIRLGTVNAKGTQELFIYAVTPKGRVETTNYRTVKLPSDLEVPMYVRDRFPEFYRAVFSEQVRKESMESVFLEYGWNMAWCDPCAAEPLSNAELRQLGVMWLQGEGANNAYVTRLHVRYDRAHFPEDLVFQETGDSQNFQARYVLRHVWNGKSDCAAAQQYRKQLRSRHETEAENLARLTGWKIDEIRKKMDLVSAATPKSGEDKSWWEKLWE